MCRVFVGGKLQSGLEAADDRRRHDRQGEQEEEEERSEDVVINDEDRAFIDDEGVAPEDRINFEDEDNDGNGITFEEAEEAREDMEDELDKLFGRGRRDSMSGNKEKEREAELLLARMEAALEADRKAFDEGKPALHKLRMLRKTEEAVSNLSYHEPLMHGGILGVLRGWLEPMPDGSLPNSRVRGSVLMMLKKLQVDCANEDHKEQLKRSGIGKLVMFLTRVPDETPENRRLAKSLVEAWSRPILGNMRMPESHVASVEREEQEQSRKHARLAKDDGGGMYPNVREKSREERKHAMIPQPAELDYVVRPKSKVAVTTRIRTGKSTEPKLLKKLRVMGKKVAK